MNLHAIEPPRPRGQHRVDGAGHLKFDFRTALDQWSEPWKFSRIPERSRGQPREGSGVARHKLARGQQRRLRYFVVGAGAIGCELIKCLALMGVGCGEGGCGACH